jgi:hypothetical protein
VLEKSPEEAEARISSIERCISRHPYNPVSPEAVFTPEELKQYLGLTDEWEALLSRAKALQALVTEKRKKGGAGG